MISRETDRRAQQSRPEEPPTGPAGPAPRRTGPKPRRRSVGIGAALASGLLGFMLVAQVQATESVGDRLAGEREEDLAAILADLSAESDRLQNEITELRLTLIEFETSAERDELALRSLQRRLDDLQVLAGVVATEGEGITLTIEDGRGAVTPDLLVDTVQELRAAGGEAIAINDVRLIASSWFDLRNARMVVDGQPVEAPYRIAAVGPSQTMAKAVDIPGGVVDSLNLLPEVSVVVEPLAQLEVPPRAEAAPFIFGEPVEPEAEAAAQPSNAGAEP